MIKIINQSQRSFIVKASQVLKGGLSGGNALEKIIPASPKVIEVTTKLGKFLATYQGILVVEEVNVPDEVEESLNVPLPETPPAEEVKEFDDDDPEVKKPKKVKEVKKEEKPKGKHK